MKGTAKEHVASYDILVDGQDVAQEQKNRIREIRVVNYLRLPDVCTFHITYPRAEGIDAQPFEVGKPLEVLLGATEQLAPTTLFKGQVLTLEPEFGSGGCSLVVRAYDRSQLLTCTRQVRTFQNQTASDIVQRVVNEAGLTPKCDSSPVVHEFIQQDNETDWDFIWRLAERIGYEFVVEDTVASFRKPSAASDVELEWPDTLRSFRPRVTGVQQVEEVTLLSHDPKTKEVIEASARRPEQIAQIGLARDKVAGTLPASTLHIATEPAETGAEATALTQALLDKLANGYVAAEGVAAGNPKIRAGATVNVSGVGQQFSGTYRVATSIHVLRGGGVYETHFSNAPSDTILGAVGSGNGAAPAFGAQLVRGIVTNNDDPLGLGRVRVNNTSLGGKAESAWARVATASAGNERGLLMLPVVGEEVLIGFEHGDTTRPYVIGSLFSGGDKPGDDLLQQKDGTFAIKSDERIYTESAKDYTIKSGGKLVIEIDGDVDETHSGDWSVDTTGAIKLKGREVTIEAGTMLTIKAGASSIKLDPSGVKVSGPTISLGP